MSSYLQKTNEKNPFSDVSKRVNVVSVKLCRETSILYKPRSIFSPGDVIELLEMFLADSDREKLIVVCLDTKNQPTAVSTVSVGTLYNTMVHPREVFKAAILSNSASIIVAHNHPSGLAEPSIDDIQVTERLFRAGEIIGIDVLDHIIVGGSNNYKSIRAMGVIEGM